MNHALNRFEEELKAKEHMKLQQASDFQANIQKEKLVMNQEKDRRAYQKINTHLHLTNQMN